MYASMDQHTDFGDKWQTIAFIDEAPEKNGTQLEGIKVIGLDNLKDISDLEECSFISGIGNAEVRKKTLERLLDKIPEAGFAKVIHRNAVIMPTANLADGVYIGSNATIGIGCDLKEHVVINFNCSVGHDVRIDPYSVISPGCVLSGRTVIGEASFLGSGAITYPSVKIGINCSIGAGLVISRKVKDNISVIAKPNAMNLPKNKCS